jgi:hypothetical protein
MKKATETQRRKLTRSKESYEMSEIRFMHIRAIVTDDHGKVVENSGSVTLAYRRPDDDPSLWIVGAAFCAPQDVYLKERGRTIALGRMGRASRRIAEDEEAVHRNGVPGSMGWIGPEPRTSTDAVRMILARLRARPYQGSGEKAGEGPLWYSEFLSAVERGDVLRKKRKARAS